ncbi:hypothetical protein like AT1G71760 [Hibiscus trionum]|uniref:MRN complex-interacting protein N-terminal domain-containing protein n=1 Tax=Hibiscus trionum TaxID=183268 RepID=A0A9W7MRN8_HIBTR|nr:hypothetical protein like AT1G71760 [Hibiscus trionum]
MSTAIFVALRCCQCSTMQVKQRKKSSNKWTCVVCNQKQSVLKVFAQGPMAKDVRKFVQSFNMSRKFTDQNQPFDPTSEYDIDFEDDDGGGGDHLENPKKRRTDWTEYLDSEDRVEPKSVLQDEDQGVDLEPEIVTELPAKEKFKRPKLRNCDNGEGSDHQLYKPVLSKRNSRKDAMLIAQDEKPVRQQQAVGDIATSGSKRSSFALKDVGNIVDSMRKYKPTTAAAAAKGNSKWRHYMTDEEEEHCCPTNSAPHVNEWGDGDGGNTEIVEDDIHPDFM